MGRARRHVHRPAASRRLVTVSSSSASISPPGVDRRPHLLGIGPATRRCLPATLEAAGSNAGGRSRLNLLHADAQACPCLTEVCLRPLAYARFALEPCGTSDHTGPCPVKLELARRRMRATAHSAVLDVVDHAFDE